MQKWEYRVVDNLNTNGRATCDSESILNQLGVQGWELVSVNWSEREPAQIASAILKRPIQSTVMDFK